MIWKIEFDFIPEITIEPILEGGGEGGGVLRGKIISGTEKRWEGCLFEEERSFFGNESFGAIFSRYH